MSDLRARLERIVAEHDSGGGVARFGGDALLADVYAALASPSPALEGIVATDARWGWCPTCQPSRLAIEDDDRDDDS